MDTLRPILNIAKLGTIEYDEALALQEALVTARRYDQMDDSLLMLEHPHVFTLGRGADERYLTNPPIGVPIHRVSRGGEVTYHGPGQLVGYPILKLEGSKRDVHGYLRMLEQVIIDALDVIGIKAGRREKLTGVWVGQRKIASIGVGIRRWVTFHGFAVNVDPAMDNFKRIVPCGIEGCEMTSVAELMPAYHPDLMASLHKAIIRSFAAIHDYQVVDLSGDRLRQIATQSPASGRADLHLGAEHD
jgi:lipoate-protein ligase B